MSLGEIEAVAALALCVNVAPRKLGAAETPIHSEFMERDLAAHHRRAQPRGASCARRRAILPSTSYVTRIVQSWDNAMQTNEKNEYSVFTTWRVEKNDVYLPTSFGPARIPPIFA